MFTDFHTAWWYLHNHEMFKDEYGGSHFEACLDTYVAKVNPLTCEMEIDSKKMYKNTKTEVWLEIGPYEKGSNIHDIDLDSGGDTYEDAILDLANNVYEHYGDSVSSKND